MCTVSYVPLKGYDFVLTSNRDEAVSRAEVLFPSSIEINHQQVLFPKDSLAGGSWIASSGKITVCLLNGAFVKHERQATYRLSRGHVLLAVFEYNNINDFLKTFDFKGIEPFTLITVYKSDDVDLFEIRWDGEQLYFKELPSHKPYIWASATLYSSEVIDARQQLFDTLMMDFDYTQASILNFHTFKNHDVENGIIMDRGDKKTVSITSILSLEDVTTISYHDLIKTTQQTAQIHYAAAEN